MSMSFFQKVKAEGEAQNAASTVFRLFNMLFNTDAPEKLIKIVTKLQSKRDINTLDKLQDFLFLRKGSKDDFLRYAESLRAALERDTETATSQH